MNFISETKESIQNYFKNKKCLRDLSKVCPNKECIFNVKRGYVRYLNCVCSRGHLECLKIIDSYYPTLSRFNDIEDNDCMGSAVFNGHYDIAFYLHSRGIRFSDTHLHSLISSAPLHVIQKLHSLRVLDTTDSIYVITAISNGRLDILKYLVNHGYVYSEHAALIALKCGRLNCYQFLVDNTECIKTSNPILYTLSSDTNYNSTLILNQNGHSIPDNVFKFIADERSYIHIEPMIRLGYNPSPIEINWIYESLLGTLRVFFGQESIYKTMSYIFQTQSKYDLMLLDKINIMPKVCEFIDFEKDVKFRNWLIGLDFNTISDLPNILKMAKNFRNKVNFSKMILYKSSKMNKDLINYIVDNFY